MHLSLMGRRKEEAPTGNIVFLGYVGDNAINLTDYTIPSADLGTPDPNRVIIVVVTTSNNASITQIDVANNRLNLAGPDAGSNIGAEIQYRSLPDGETGDIRIRASSNIYSITWYAGYTSNSTPISGEINKAGAGIAPSVSIDTQGDGFVVYGLSKRTDSSVRAPIWSGSSSPVHDSATVFSASTRFGASGSMPVDGGDNVVGGTFTVEAPSDSNALSVASWGP